MTFNEAVRMGNVFLITSSGESVIVHIKLVRVSTRVLYKVTVDGSSKYLTSYYRDQSVTEVVDKLFELKYHRYQLIEPIQRKGVTVSIVKEYFKRKGVKAYKLLKSDPQLGSTLQHYYYKEYKYDTEIDHIGLFVERGLLSFEQGLRLMDLILLSENDLMELDLDIECIE